MKKRFIQAPAFSKSGAGFTLIELTIIFSVIAVLSVIGISVSIDYNRTQIVNSAYEELKSTLNTAKSRALSQNKPEACTGTLSEYRVVIVQATRRYYLRVICPNTITMKVVTLPQNVVFDSSPTFFFPILIGGATGGTVILTGYNKSKTITVDSAGNIK